MCLDSSNLLSVPKSQAHCTAGPALIILSRRWGGRERSGILNCDVGQVFFLGGFASPRRASRDCRLSGRVIVDIGIHVMIIRPNWRAGAGVCQVDAEQLCRCPQPSSHARHERDHADHELACRDIG